MYSRNAVKLSFASLYALCLCVFADYWSDRNAFIETEESEMLGSSVVLNDKERVVNDILMRYKFREYDSGFKNPSTFAPGRHFFDARKDIEKSKVFQFIRKVPKGAALHGHDLSIASLDYIMNVTYKDDLYACLLDKQLKLKFLLDPNQDRTCTWKLVKDLRKADPLYDEWLRSRLTLEVKNPKVKYPNIDVVWQAFANIFAAVYDMITYRPVFQEYIYQALKELYDDHVIYLELRGTLPQLYEINGTRHDQIRTAAFYEETVSKFKRDRPDSFGARFIYAPHRRTDNGTAEDYVAIVKTLKERHPNFLAGFDLVGQEDKGRPLVEYLKQLKEIAADGINFFFHAGETDWFGSSTDFNLIDAILLGTKRIGHGYAIVKHPLAMKKVMDEQIAIEVCPISNQVLMLVDDIRNHPAAHLIAGGYPVVVSSDDPGFWSIEGLSYDFYMTFVGIAGRNADLRVIKQLAYNSLWYSAMPELEKRDALKTWGVQWDKFIQTVLDARYKGSF